MKILSKKEKKIHLSCFQGSLLNRLGKVRQPCIAEREQAKDTAGLMFKSQPSQYTDLPESILLRKIDSGSDDFKLCGAGSFPKKAALQQRPEEGTNSY